MLFFSLVVISSKALPCSLIETDLQAYFDRAEHVFSGQLAPDVTGSEIVAGTVGKKWKGTPFDDFLVEVPQFATSCHLPVQTGLEYIFFVSGEPPFELVMGSGTIARDDAPTEWLENLDGMTSTQ